MTENFVAAYADDITIIVTEMASLCKVDRAIKEYIDHNLLPNCRSLPRFVVYQIGKQMFCFM